MQLGEQAIECLLKQSGLTRERLAALFFVSVTGVCSPSIDARLVNRMKLSPNIKRNPIFGLGCVAGAAGSRVPRIMFALTLTRLPCCSLSSCALSPGSEAICP